MMKGVNFCMPAQWTAEIIGEMHLNRITAKELSAHLGYNPKYVSAVLNGHRTPKKAEQMFRKALNELIQEKQNGGT
jgi:metal-dependent hydrolase (beta-lactamase superfamily II)